MPAPSREINESIFVIDILTPADDPFLRQLPPHLPIPGWGNATTVLEKDPLIWPRKDDAPKEARLPEQSALGAG
jgi:hypothetical protein